VLDPIDFVCLAAPTPLLFQFAQFEKYFSEASAREYADSASSPKMVCWYESGHDLNDIRAVVDRSRFLEEHIGVGSIVPLIEEKVRTQD
jgi:hypothetical protein